MQSKPSKEEVQNFIQNDIEKCKREFPRVFWGNLMLLALFVLPLVGAVLFAYDYYFNSLNGEFFRESSYQMRKLNHKFFGYLIAPAGFFLLVVFYLFKSFVKNIFLTGRTIFGFDLELTQAELELATELIYELPADAEAVYQKTLQEPIFKRVVEVLTITGIVFEKGDMYNKGDIKELFTQAELDNWFESQKRPR